MPHGAGLIADQSAGGGIARLALGVLVLIAALTVVRLLLGKLLSSLRESPESADPDRPAGEREPAVADDAALVCPSCLTESTSPGDFCTHCGAPLGATTTLDPLKSVYATGWMYRRAASGRPARIKLLGMWLIFGPALFIGVAGLLRVRDLRSATISDLFILALVLAFLTINVLILHRTTWSYFRGRRGARRSNRGECENCGYLLRGLSEPRCPECGTPFRWEAGGEGTDGDENAGPEGVEDTVAEEASAPPGRSQGSAGDGSTPGGSDD